ncbi:MAG TPA: DUF3987 domain-containing protein [Flavisolibacter sp.]|jgi:hypothetical protein|nr:DUF3987 domain-containing protein [Flavisolibacter sp.]
MSEKLIIPAGTDLNALLMEPVGEKEKGRENEPSLIFEANTLKMPDFVYENLPYPLSRIHDFLKDPQKRDLTLLTTLVILSGTLRNYTVQYGDKEEGCQLYIYVLGNAAQGKGFAANLKRLGSKWHKYLAEQYKSQFAEYKRQLEEYKREKDSEHPIPPVRKFLFLAGDSSKASILDLLEGNDGYALIFETEADTLVVALSNDYGNFTDMLRKGFHGEDYMVSRKDTGLREIDSLRIAVFLTSTLNQCFRLLPSYEDGTFSRFAFYIIPSGSGFQSVFTQSNSDELNKWIEEVSELILQIGLADGKNSKPLRFQFTELQKLRYEAAFVNIDEQLKKLYGDTLDASIRRLALTFTRYCMLLSYLRAIENTGCIPSEDITCGNHDFETALLIVQKQVHHLQHVDFLYKKQNKRFSSMVSIPTKGGVEQKDRFTDEQKINAVKLLKTGKSSREVAEGCFGDKGKYVSVLRWEKAFDAGLLHVTQHVTTGGKVLPKAGENIIEDVESLLASTFVSSFKNVSESRFVERVECLLSFLINPQHEAFVKKVRNAPADEFKTFKASLPAITPSGRFNKIRSKNSLKSHSGFICIDIDQKDNQHIKNFRYLWFQLKNILQVAFCAKSVSGRGYYALIPIKDVDKHEQYFDALKEAFEMLGINIDPSGRDVSRLRIASYDDDFWLADSASYFDTVLELNHRRNLVAAEKGNGDEAIDDLVSLIQSSGVDITAKYEYWFAIGCALANELGENGREYFHAISSFYPTYTTQQTDKQFDACLDGRREKGFTISTLFYIAKQYGLSFS